MWTSSTNSAGNSSQRFWSMNRKYRAFVTRTASMISSRCTGSTAIGAPLVRRADSERRVRSASDGSDFQFRGRSCHERHRARPARLRRAHVPRARGPRDRAARPRGVQRQVRHELLPRRRGRRGQDVVRGWWHAHGEGRRRDRRLPTDRRAADARRSVRAGEDRRPRRHGSRSTARGLDRSDDPRARGRVRTKACGAGHPSRSSRATRAGLPRENYRKLIDGYKWLVEQGLRRHPRTDDLGQLPHVAADRGRDRRARHRMDRRAQVRERLLLHGRQRRHPDRRA